LKQEKYSCKNKPVKNIKKTKLSPKDVTRPKSSTEK
jgi:hypothetical protein